MEQTYTEIRHKKRVAALVAVWVSDVESSVGFTADDWLTSPVSPWTILEFLSYRIRPIEQADNAMSPISSRNQGKQPNLQRHTTLQTPLNLRSVPSVK
ncbi:hypothetical protein ElyMa_002396900, partial [Elysia marginata]